MKSFFILFTVLQLLKANCKLIWISIDSLGSDIIKTGDFEFLEELAKNGVYVQKVHAMFPSEKFPNHFSAATGLNIEEHGVGTDSNTSEYFENIYESKKDKNWWDRNNKTLPIWTIVEKNGGRSAVIYWPGSAVEFGGTYPSFYHKNTSSQCTLACRMNETIDLFKTGSYDLIMVYITNYDITSHRDGPYILSARDTMLLINNVMKNFIDSIKQTKSFDNTSIMISGAYGVTAVSNDRIVLAKKCLNDFFVKRMVMDGPVGMFNCTGAECGIIISKLKNCTHVRFSGYTKDLPKEFYYYNNRSILNVIVIMEEGWMIKASDRNYKKGSNGYPWQWVKSMNSEFIGFNGKFMRGSTLESLEVTDLFSIACSALNLKQKCHTKRRLPYGIFRQSALYIKILSILANMIVIVLMIRLAIVYYRRKKSNKIYA